MARILVSLGITKVRITGGEPLLRKGVVEFVRELAKFRPQGLKPESPNGANGTTEVVPSRSSPQGLKPQSIDAASGTSGTRALPGVAEEQRQRAPRPKAFDREDQQEQPLSSQRDRGLPLDLAITTNGHLLAYMAQPLKDAGLNRVTVSMDAVDSDRFTRITRVPGGFDHVLAGMRAARDAGLGPVKVNCVLMRGFNEDQIVPFGMFARDEGVVVRFIEFMPLEEDRVWAPSTVVPLEEILQRMDEYRPLVEIPKARSETARRYRFDDGIGEIGIIAPVSHPFCGHCSRIRITSDGKIRTCLFSVWDHDLHALMRHGASDDELADFIIGVVQKKEERHHIGEPDFVPASRTMVHIGG